MNATGDLVPLGLGLAGLSALSTAAAHAFLKAGRDKLAVQAWIRLIGLAVAVPLIAFTGLPPPDLWPWLIAAAAVHAVYQVALIGSYRWNDFAVGFPIARGTAPLLTAMGGAWLLGDQMGSPQWLGIMVIVASIIVLVAGQSVTFRGLTAAIGAGALTCVYSLVDAAGMRTAPDALNFLGWFYLCDAIAMPLLFAVLRPRHTWVETLWAERKAGIGAGIGALAAFVPALLAFRYAPAGAVAAIRETSVVGAVIASHLWLHETPGWRHWFSAVGVAAGAILLVIAPR